MVAISADDREIRKNDVERVLEATKLVSISSDKEIIGIEPKQFIIDGYDNIKDPIGMSGLRLEVEAEVLIAKTTVVNNLIKSVNKAGIDVKGICLQPRATSKVVLTEEEKDMGVALVNVGAETIDITIIKNENICFTSIIPIGGNSITNDIALGLKLSFNEAEKLKIKYANLLDIENPEKDIDFVKPSDNEEYSIDYKFFKEILEARVEELVNLAKNEIEKSGFYEQISNIVIVGGGIALIKGVTSFAKHILKKTVKIGSPEYVGAANPIYAVAVGIVKDASDTFKQSEISDEFYENVENSSIWEQNNKKEFENVGVLTKVKKFLADFF